MTDSHQFGLSKIEMNIGGIGIYCFDFSTSMTSYGTKQQILNGRFGFDNIEIAEGDNYVEIGAHNGALAFYTARKFPKANIHVFECNPFMIAAINYGIVANGFTNIKCYPFGLSTYNGNCDFGISFDNTGGSSMLVHDGHHIKDQKVKVFDFETILSTFEYIKYLKIDIEGEEFKIFDSLISKDSKFFDRVSTLNLEIHDLIYPDFDLDRSGIKEYLSTYENLNVIYQD